MLQAYEEIIQPVELFRIFHSLWFKAAVSGNFKFNVAMNTTDRFGEFTLAKIIDTFQAGTFLE